MILTPRNQRSTVTGKDGITRSLTVPLVRAPGRPQGGWRTTLKIKDQQVPVPGNNPQEVYRNAVALLARNGQSLPAATIWTTLNAAWLQRTPEKYHLVPLAELLALSTAAPEEAKDSRKRSYKPSDWGAGAWMWLNLFLARESYNFREFLLQCQYVLDLLNPNTNDALGCSLCYSDWAQHVEELKAHPEWDRQQAREWLVKVHNQVSSKIGKKVLTFDEAAKKAFWT